MQEVTHLDHLSRIFHVSKREVQVLFPNETVDSYRTVFAQGWAEEGLRKEMPRRPGRSRRWLQALSAPIALLAATALFSAAAPAAADQRPPDPVATIGPAPDQTMDGFGASGAWWPNDLVRFPTAVQKHVADLLFGPAGLALSAYRYNLGGGGVGVTTPSRAAPTFLVSPGRYDWSADPGGTTFLRLAHQHDVAVLEGFVNSAPSVWTTNHRNCGGQLGPGDEQSFAAYLAAVTRHLATAEGIELTAVSPMNEPDNSFGSCGQEGMAVPVAQRSTMVRDLGVALAHRAPFARVIADESSLATFQFLPEVPQWLVGGNTSRALGALAHHTYEFPTDAQAAMVAPLGPRFGKPLWMTEICCYDGKGPLVGFGPQYDPTIISGLWLADTIYQDVAVIGDAQFDWWTALSDQLGCDPHQSGCATTLNNAGWNDGLLYYDPAFATDGNHAIYPTKRFDVLGNFSRFVRPGAVRHTVTGAPSGVRVLAFDRDGRWSVVVINDNVGTVPARFEIAFPGKRPVRPVAAVRTSSTDSLTPRRLPPRSADGAVVEVPPQSVTTYIFRS